MLQKPVTDIIKVNKRHREALSRLNIHTLEDLVGHLPNKYLNLKKITPIAHCAANNTYAIKGEVKEIKNIRTWKKKLFITQAIIQDESGAIKAQWYRQPYLAKTLKNKTQIFHGKTTFTSSGCILQNPIYEDSENNIIIPIYPQTKGITSKYIRKIFLQIKEQIPEIESLIPSEAEKNHNLIDKKRAITQIHFPESIQQISQAKKTLAFEELFALQIKHAQKRSENKKNKSYKIPFDKNCIENFINSLPFTLTNDQKKATWAIIKDIQKSYPMNRLIEGDVGSGKTVVAAAILKLITHNKLQGIFVSPTEILAKQHFNTIASLLPNTATALLTRSQAIIHSKNKSKKSSEKDIKKQFEAEKIEILIGTHAILQGDIKTQKVALAIVDEQHRFGVNQRKTITTINTNKKSPHLLSMTATPIPRTLSLALQGDLDISIIKEKPKNRKPITTKFVTENQRSKTYDFINQQIKKNEQVFVVCPLIEESDKLGVKSVTQEYEKLQTIFEPDQIGLLHGKLKSEEKEEVMNQFKNGKTKILVSTTVIEVGVDIPNATIMLIEGAERFGLAQLHQLRGRIGRNDKNSYCFIFSDSTNQDSINRLKNLEKIDNGFDLSIIDLKTRGPGEVFGTKQSGLPPLKLAALEDSTLVENAHKEAIRVLEKDPTLEKHKRIKEFLEKEIEKAHFE